MRCIKDFQKNRGTIENLIDGFPEKLRPLIRETIANLALTRTSGMIAASRVIVILERWRKIEDPSRIEYGCTVYNQKRYYLQRKGEAYLLAIMLNASSYNLEQCTCNPCTKCSPATLYNLDVFRAMDAKRAR